MLKFFREMWADLNAPDPISQNISPDAMIVNGLIQSFASDYSDWKLDWTQPGYTQQYSKLPDIKYATKPGGWCDSGESTREFKLVNDKKKITLTIKYKFDRIYKFRGLKQNLEAYCNLRFTSVTVNGVSLSAATGKQLVDAYLLLKGKHDATQSAAAKALADMKADEAKWNIAEQILDMKRTKSGRLIAKSSYCAVCDSPDSGKEKEKLHNLSCPNRPAPRPRRPKIVAAPFKEI